MNYAYASLIYAYAPEGFFFCGGFDSFVTQYTSLEVNCDTGQQILLFYRY